MNQKIFLGILIPSILIIALILLSLIPFGFSVTSELKPSLPLRDLFGNDYLLVKYITVETISIKNDFFIPRKYVLPRYLACATKENVLDYAESFEVKYSEGREEYHGYDEFFFPYNYQQELGIDISPYSEKSVIIALQQKGPSPYNKKNIDYTHLLLIPLKPQDRYRPDCYRLSSEDREQAKVILLE